MESWVMNIEKVNEYNFLNKKLRNSQAGGVRTWLKQEALVAWSKKSSNVVYEV